eukprot:1106244-Lingulodinium_polyedra.AAC.1
MGPRRSPRLRPAPLALGRSTADAGSTTPSKLRRSSRTAVPAVTGTLPRACLVAGGRAAGLGPTRAS